MPATPIVTDEIYHVYNRGDQKQVLFRNDRDYARMLFALLYFQSPKSFRNIKRKVDVFMHEGSFGVDGKKVVDDRHVELINFCLMPNHFHLTVKNVASKGISSYLQRLQNSYGRYFNTKYDKTGYVFEGPYRSKHVSTDVQLQYLSAYIHKNPKELTGEKKYSQYQWSSYTDYLTENRWGDLLALDVILDGYSSVNQYQEFVESTEAKEQELDI